MSSDSTKPARIASLDQFRGYTVAGMFLVNFVGSFAVCPRILRHTNDYCSYADTIMPQFLFAVGFAFRLTFERRVQREGASVAYSRAIRRILGLAAIAFAVYVLLPAIVTWPAILERQPSELAYEVLKRDWCQTLLHIAITSLWILPVIRSSTLVRIVFVLASAALHISLSAWFNFEWVNTSPNGIDGGPLGFLTWTIPAIAGTLACDMVTAASVRSPIAAMLRTGAGLMLAGWIISGGTRLYDLPSRSDHVVTEGESNLSPSPVFPPRASWEGRRATDLLAEPPFVPPPDAKHRKWNYWMMSQRAGTVSYLTFSAGFSMSLFALFYVVCDVLGDRSGLFQTLGVNALAGYVIHDPVADFVKSFTPRESSAVITWFAFAIYFVIVWAILKLMERRGVFFRL
jgi:predicted acyltransferase